jgi:hypothetical protein
MFQTGFLSISRSSKLNIQRQVFVRPILLPAASLAGMVSLAAGSSCWLHSANILALHGTVNVKSISMGFPNNFSDNIF